MVGGSRGPPAELLPSPADGLLDTHIGSFTQACMTRRETGLDRYQLEEDW